MEHDDERHARSVAAKIAGIREDQVATAVEAYREALASLHNEPEWRVAMHFNGMAVCHAEGTEVQMDYWPAKGKRPTQQVYGYRGKPYSTFAEARAAELRDSARTKLVAVTQG